MNLCDCLEYFRQTCGELLCLGAEENQCLRRECTPDDSLLERKRQYLGRLNAALTQLRAVDLSAQKDGRSKARVVKAEVQQMLMRLMLLDRENEQLLLKCSFRVTPRNILPSVKAPAVGNLYQKGKRQ